MKIKLFVILFLTSLTAFANTRNCQGKVTYTDNITKTSKDYSFEFYVSTYIDSCREVSQRPQRSFWRSWGCAVHSPMTLCYGLMRPKLVCSKSEKTRIHLVHNEFTSSRLLDEKIELFSMEKSLGKFDSFKFSLELDGESSEYFTIQGKVELSKNGSGGALQASCNAAVKHSYKQIDLSEHQVYLSQGCDNHSSREALPTTDLGVKLTVNCK